MSTGYASAFDTYHRLGWPVLPIPHGEKDPPPTGYTGRTGAMPSYADMQAWSENKPDANLAIRLPRTVIGIDVDDWGGKNGGATFAEAEKRWGKLPVSYYSTSRSDGVSRIRLFRIPEGIELVQGIGFPELNLGGIEVCQFHHRYVLCAPSINPDTGNVYRWYAEIDGSVMDQPPALDDIPDLPAQWVDALRAEAHNGAELPPGGAYDVRNAITEGDMSQRVALKLGQALAYLHGTDCRHDETLRKVAGLLRVGKNGEPGVKRALQALREAFANVAAETNRKGGRTVAITEFNRMVTGERVGELLADPKYDDEAGKSYEGEINSSATDSVWKFTDGANFILDIPDTIPALWGRDNEILWAEGESLMIAGPMGLGKTTLLGLLIRAQLGIGDCNVFGLPVTARTYCTRYSTPSPGLRRGGVPTWPWCMPRSLKSPNTPTISIIARRRN